MSKTAHYIVCLSRNIVDGTDYEKDETYYPDGHDGTELGGIHQVNREMQEVYDTSSIAGSYEILGRDVDDHAYPDLATRIKLALKFIVRA